MEQSQISCLLFLNDIGDLHGLVTGFRDGFGQVVDGCQIVEQNDIPNGGLASATYEIQHRLIQHRGIAVLILGTAAVDIAIFRVQNLIRSLICDMQNIVAVVVFVINSTIDRKLSLTADGRTAVTLHFHNVCGIADFKLIYVIGTVIGFDIDKTVVTKSKTCTTGGNSLVGGIGHVVLRYCPIADVDFRDVESTASIFVACGRRGDVQAVGRMVEVIGNIGCVEGQSLNGKVLDVFLL